MIDSAKMDDLRAAAENALVAAKSDTDGGMAQMGIAQSNDSERSLRNLRAYAADLAAKNNVESSRMMAHIERRIEMLQTPEGAERLAKEDSEREAQREAIWRRNTETAIVNEKLRDSGIPSRYLTANFETNHKGQALVRNQFNEKGIVYCERLAQRWKPGLTGVILRSENTGTGKSYAISAAGVALIRRHVNVRMTTMDFFLKALRASYGTDRLKNTDALSSDAVFRKYAMEPDVLILDELGGERTDSGEKGDWAREQILGLVNYRLDQRKTICATTNLTKAELLEIYHRRTMSRLTEAALWIEMDSEDFRERPSDDPYGDD